MRRITGVIFSDLGQASSFMALDWVQVALKKSLGFASFPATLNVRPKAPEDERNWEAVQNDSNGIPLAPVDGGFCSARLYPIEIQVAANFTDDKIRGAILLPHVAGYPKDKIEIIAAVKIKEALGLHDGDQITLEFVVE
jgi:CTP-dependent riboflavin kinase